MLKGKLAGFAVAGLLLGAGVVSAEESAFPGSVDEAGIYLPSASTYADRYRNELEHAATSADPAFPGSVDEAGIYLPSASTYADRYRDELEHAAATAADSAFPGSVDEAGIYLPSASTYADQHRDRIMGSLQAGSNTSASPRSNGTN